MLSSTSSDSRASRSFLFPSTVAMWFLAALWNVGVVPLCLISNVICGADKTVHLLQRDMSIQNERISNGNQVEQSNEAEQNHQVEQSNEAEQNNQVEQSNEAEQSVERNENEMSGEAEVRN